MSVVPMTAGPEAAGPDDHSDAIALDVSASYSWVRPVAAVVLILAMLALALLLSPYFDDYGSIAAAPDSPRSAAAILAGVAALMAAAVLVFRPERGDLRSLVGMSAAWSATLFIALVFAWAAMATSDRQDTWHGTPMFGVADVDTFLAEHVRAGVDPVRIPTGVLIKSMEFLNGDNVQVTGFVWQRFTPDMPEDLVPGVVLAEGVKEAFDAKEVYRLEKDGTEVIGWYFFATLRQPFEYAEFPFDEQDVWLRLWSRDFATPTVLVPDFNSYPSMDPKLMPGLEKEFVYSGWSPKYSGFSLSNQPYSTSFGVGYADEFVNLPEMYFNLILDRNFAGPFFEHLVFALAVTILLFGMLVLTTNDESLKARFQLSTAGVLGASSGLLFAVILKHNQLRTVVGARGVSYIELIPIILYGVIIVVVLNAILVASPRHVKLVHHRNNLIPVLAYWPVLFGIVLAVTLIVFFQN